MGREAAKRAKYGPSSRVLAFRLTLYPLALHPVAPPHVVEHFLQLRVSFRARALVGGGNQAQPRLPVDGLAGLPRFVRAQRLPPPPRSRSPRCAFLACLQGLQRLGCSYPFSL